MVPAKPLRLVGKEPERGRVRLREPEAGEADELVEDRIGDHGVHALRFGPGHEPVTVGLERVVAPLPAHRSPQPFGFPDREARERDRDLEHLILEDDDAEGRAQRLAQELVVDGPDVGRVVAQPLARVDVRVHGLPLDRPRPHERDLHGEVVEVLGLRPQEALHLRSALDLEGADRVRALYLFEHFTVVKCDPREVDHLVSRARDLLDAVLDRGEHPEPEQIDLEKAGVGARVLVPLAELAAGHRRRLHGDDLDERARRDDHPARVLRDVPREARDLAGEPGERPPAARVELALPVREIRHLLADPLRVPAVGEPREPFELREREAERFADVPDRPPRAIRREARDERGVLAPVALRHSHDELLADVAREVEVDVGNRRELPVQEATERELVRDRVDVREAGEVADDGADRAPTPASGREELPRRAVPAHLERALPRELEHLMVEEEEAREPELVDEAELVLEAGAPPVVVGAGHARPLHPVALVDRGAADRGELEDRGLLAVREVGVAVAELFREIERQALGEPRRSVPRRRGRAGRAPASPRAHAGSSPGSRAARARSPRATCGSGSRRGRPAAACGAGGARGRRRSRSSPRRGAPRGRAASAFLRASPRSNGRWSSTWKRSRPNAAASRAAPFGLRTPTPCLAQPERQTRPSFSSATSSSETEGGSGSRSSLPGRRVPACAAVSSRQRFA